MHNNKYGYTSLNHWLAGGAVNTNDPDGNLTSVTPAWRKALTHWSFINAFNYTYSSD